MATSGTVGSTTFTTRQVIDHAMRRCKLAPQQITPEHIQTCLELLWLSLSTWGSKGLALWAIDRPLIGLGVGRVYHEMPSGTLDVMNANLRTVSLVDGTDAHTSGVNNYYTKTLTTAGPVTQVGFRPNNFLSTTWSFVIQVSSDNGVSYTTRVTVLSKAVTFDDIYWYDVSGESEATQVRIFGINGTTLQIQTFTAGYNAADIPLALVDRDTYSTLPNKNFLGRPTQYMYDRQRSPSSMVLWPLPSSAYTDLSMLALYTHRQIQDVGTMSQELELPQRWYMAAVCDLARNAAREIKEVDPSLIPSLDVDAERQLQTAWDGETDRAPVRLLPNIRGYTR